MIVYLNGEYVPAEQARISPLDRGFLFGDGIYEAIPSYAGRAVALQLHLERMKRGLAAISLKNPFFDHAEAALFTAHRNGWCVGRISAQIDREHLRIHNDGAGFFGNFECVDDGRVSAALFDAAE